MRAPPLIFVVACGLGLASVGCGERIAIPTTPSNGTAPGIAVNSSSARLFLGASETFTATMISSTGATSAVTGTWGTDAPGVVTVTAAGVVTGLASGEATVFVDVQGQRGSKKITVSPNYSGDWIGSYTVLTCTQTGGWIPGDFCTTTFIVNKALPYEILMTNVTVTTVSGQTALGGLVSNTFSTSAAANGTLPIAARYVAGTLTGDETWLLNSTTDGKITGTLSVTFRDSTLSGDLVVTGRLLETTRGAAGPGGPAS